MSIASAPATVPRPSPRPDPVAWHCWPLIDGAPWSLLTLLIPPALAWGIQYIAGSWLMGVFMTGVLMWGVWRYWIPIYWCCDDQGLSLRVLIWRRRIPWSNFRSFHIRQNGILLLPNSAAVPIDALRAIYVPWGKRRTDVLRHVEWRLGNSPQRGTSDGSASRTKIQAAPRGNRKKPGSTATGSLNVFFDFFR